MGTLTTKIGNAFASIRDTYKRLGEYDVEDVDINDFASVSTSNISQKEYADLKKALSEVGEMERDYIADMKKRNSRGQSLSSVSNSKQVKSNEPKKAKANLDKEKDRED